MRNLKSLVLVAATGIFAVGCASVDKSAPTPTLVVTTPVVTLSPNNKVVMYGSGFTPKQEISLVLKDAGGGLSGISGSVVPASPVANADGVWAAEFTYTAYLSALRPGTALLFAVDQDFKTLAQAPILFVAAPKPPAKPEAAPAKPEAKPAAAAPAKPAAKPAP